MSKILKQVAYIVVLLLFAWASVSVASHETALTSLSHVQLESTTDKLNLLQVRYQSLSQSLSKAISSGNKSQSTINQLQQQINALNAQKQALESQISQASAPSSPTTVYAAGLCGDNWYAHQIYMAESSCSTTAQNALGCVGIGQACPGAKLRGSCPQLTYACENAYFDSYAVSRYGSWANAYAFHIANGWW